MQPLFTPTVVSYSGLYADDHLIDVQQLGQSLTGFGKAANGIAHFYLNGLIVKDTRLFDVRVFTGPPRAGSVLFEFWAIMASSQLPLYPSILLNMANEFLPLVWRAVVERALGRNSMTEAIVGQIAELANGRDEFVRQVHEGHMRDKQWLQDHISCLTETLRSPLKKCVTPIGRSCRTERIWPEHPKAVEIDEADAQVLRSKGEQEVGDARQFDLRLHALNIDTGTGRAEILGETGHLVPVKITDPALSNPRNPYTHSLDQQTYLRVTAKPTLHEGLMVRLFISDAIVE